MMPSASPPSLLPERWFPTRKPLPDARLRLFCVPFAGGTVAAFNGWSALLPPGVELCAVQLPGRERRLMEKPFDDLTALVDTLLPLMEPLLDRPFALFGYSMGARINLELARRLQARGGRQPVGLFMAASISPHVRDSEPIHHLPHDAFVAELRRYDGTPEEVLRHKELLELVVPTLRADFALAWWESGQQPIPVDAPISVMGATHDGHVPTEKLTSWRSQTRSNDFQVRTFPGGHFFLRQQQAALLSAIAADLTRWMQSPA
ncbi:alpha/beta fold hydrolase [Myxococcus sp. K15C18031901]|uniref:thioesterase II family protein n=1 Tax=Myxococcus dinghuensis TaxID=2906761 RepID=UPI0020A79D8A|nr:thioesterase domain-containing protein [Myxococcus dinghuensis]MCP3101722.1 alpha/beta fold hydrolase [Myxococcus dinghuensis]